MAFETHLVAISWRSGMYSVVSQTTADINEKLLQKEGLLHDVSEGFAYSDEAAIMRKANFAKYLLPESSHPWDIAARHWYESLSAEAEFIFVHVAEWESGLD